jgi:hypothetical protein
MHDCGACGRPVLSVLFERTGLRGVIELSDDGRGNVAILLELPGMRRADELRRVVSTRDRTNYREHNCPKARSFSAANFQRKRR